MLFSLKEELLMANHQWQCRNCGKKSGILNSSNPNPTPSVLGGKCPNSSSGQHILEKIK